MRTIKPDDLFNKSLTAFFKDVGNQYQVKRIDQDRDIHTALCRYRKEGLGFVTKTLPNLGKHFDQALKSGHFHLQTSFRTKKGETLPCFMQGLLKLVFTTNGTLLDNPDINAIRLIRQLCFMFYKVEGDYPQELVDESIGNFIKVDRCLQECDRITPAKAGGIYHASRILGIILAGFDPKDISPRTGPGQSSTKIPHELRYEPLVKYPKLHSAYPYYSYMYMNSRHLLDRVKNYRNLPEKQSISRLAIVPKDSRGPRIICMEPPEYMWIQQGLGRAIMAHLERHWMTAGKVNFSDQSINGDLALSSSKSGEYATLDMKEASDRVSSTLVESLFEEVPDVLRCLQATSTEYIELPDGRMLRKRKYAPMGSALCFPVMSLVHFSLAVASIHMATGLSYKAIAKTTYVYGDDIIVATEHAQALFDTFPDYGLKFNVDKSCTTGKFRESCGIDAYDGVNITPQRVKTYTSSKRSPSSLASHLAMFHGFFNRGLWKLAKVWQDRIDRTWGKLPCVSKTSATMGWIVPRTLIIEANASILKYDDKLQSQYVSARINSARPDRYMIGSWEQLVRSQLETEQGSDRLIRRGHNKMLWSRIPLSCL